METRRHDLVVPATLAGRRLDQALAELLPEYSRSRLKDWIDQGRVSLDGRVPRPRDRVLGGETVRLEAELPVETSVEPEAMALDLVYEDEDIIVIDKPAGLVVHPGAGNPTGTLQNGLLAHRPTLAALPRAGIVHRLDKDTTGLMVVAASVAAHTALVRDLEAREVRREYEAVCLGVLTAGGTVDAPISRHPTDRVKMAVRQGGREAVTHYRVIQRFRRHTHLLARLETGRTHQIRVHMAHVRHPLMGDPVYGGRLVMPPGATDSLRETLRGFRRQALHARRLGLTHPVSGEAMAWEAPVPDDFASLLAALAEDAERNAE